MLFSIEPSIIVQGMPPLSRRWGGPTDHVAASDAHVDTAGELRAVEWWVGTVGV